MFFACNGKIYNSYEEWRFACLIDKTLKKEEKKELSDEI